MGKKKSQRGEESDPLTPEHGIQASVLECNGRKVCSGSSFSSLSSLSFYPILSLAKEPSQLMVGWA